MNKGFSFKAPIGSLVLGLMISVCPSLCAQSVTNSKHICHPLVNERNQPDEDEFYVDSLYSVNDKAVARISRAKDARKSDELFVGSIAYLVGDNLTDDLVIKKIEPGDSRVTILKVSENKYYSIKMTYGASKSRLVPLSKELEAKLKAEAPPAEDATETPNT